MLWNSSDVCLLELNFRCLTKYQQILKTFYRVRLKLLNEDHFSAVLKRVPAHFQWCFKSICCTIIRLPCMCLLDTYCSIQEREIQKITG